MSKTGIPTGALERQLTWWSVDHASIRIRVQAPEHTQKQQGAVVADGIATSGEGKHRHILAVWCPSSLVKLPSSGIIRDPISKKQGVQFLRSDTNS